MEQEADDVLSLLPYCDPRTQKRLLQEIAAKRPNILTAVNDGPTKEAIRLIFGNLDAASKNLVLAACRGSLAASLRGFETREDCKAWFTTIGGPPEMLDIMLGMLKTLPVPISDSDADSDPDSDLDGDEVAHDVVVKLEQQRVSVMAEVMKNCGSTGVEGPTSQSTICTTDPKPSMSPLQRPSRSSVLAVAGSDSTTVLQSIGLSQ